MGVPVDRNIVQTKDLHITSFHNISTPSVFCEIYTDFPTTFLKHMIINMTTCDIVCFVYSNSQSYY